MWDRVGPGHAPGGQEHGWARSVGGRICPHIAVIPAVESRDLAVQGSCKSDVRLLVTAVDRGPRQAPASVDPLHGPPDFPRQEEKEGLGRVDIPLGAVASADVGHDHAKLVIRDAKHKLRDQEAVAMGDLGVGPEGIFPCLGIVSGQGAAGFFGMVDHSLTGKPLPNDHLGGGDGVFSRLFIAVNNMRAEVVGNGRMELGGSFLQRFSASTTAGNGS